jgi:hypothetical protein
VVRERGAVFVQIGSILKLLFKDRLGPWLEPVIDSSGETRLVGIARIADDLTHGWVTQSRYYYPTESLRAGTFLRDILPARAYRSRLSRILLVWRHHINTMTSAGLEKVLHLAAAQLLDFTAA